MASEFPGFGVDGVGVDLTVHATNKDLLRETMIVNDWTPDYVIELLDEIEADDAIAQVGHG